ncbi:hypothetical protein [uncultured Chryseobacterium sp.]|uniref:hypothetical protein n=1 Tax=uncultured Chryseobacterium sp. TaxID=259322 RepID=UPI0025DC43A8|nr:hypothetical protein [uncultured Chryseobacterium sp.]
MKKRNFISLSCMVLLLSFLSLSAEPLKCKARTVTVAGLIIDAITRAPLADAKVYGETGNFIASTDSRGYFKGTVSNLRGGPVRFSIKIEKEGYSSFTQKEHWADMGDDISAIYYFGLEKKAGGKRNKAFSELISRTKDTSYASVVSGFSKFEEQLNFRDGLEAAKEGNEKVFITIGDQYFLVNDSGWILLTSPKDKISVDGKRIVTASEINSKLKRKQIRRMTPSGSKDFSFEVYTR